jgi:hypothetical protein
MSKLARILVLVAMVAAMNLAGLTAIAQAQATDQPTSSQNARRPPTEAQVGEPYRYYHDALAAQGQSADAVERFRRGERASQDQPTTDNPTQVTAPRQPAEPRGQPGWLVALLGVLVALVAGLAVLAARRFNRRTGVGQAT